MKKQKVLAYTGFFIFSLSLLMAEIVYSRTARIALGYEYQLLVITLAISGLGFGGVPIYFLFKRMRSRVSQAQAVLALAYAACVPLPFLTVNNLGAEYASDNIAADTTYFGVSTGTMIQFCVAVFLVYVIAGAFITVFLRCKDQNISAAYSVSLIGSAAGALLVVPILNSFGNEKTIVITLGAALAAAWFFILQAGVKRYMLAGLLTMMIAAVAGLCYWSPALKPGGFEGEKVISGSNSFSQVSVYSVAPYGEAKNLSKSYDKSVIPSTQGYSLVYDRKLKTNAVVFSRLSDTAYLRHDLLYFPYFLLDKPDVMLLGAGAGIDVVRARLADSRRITAAEMNPLIIDIARDKIKTTAYDDKRVRLVIGEARTSVLRLGEKYDLIYMSNTGGFGGKKVNSHYYPENYLHTREAFLTYLDHLRPGGMLSIGSRNSIVKEYVGVGIEALASRGLDAVNRVALIDGGGMSVVIFKTAGFTSRDRQAIGMNAARLRFDATFPAKPLNDTAAGGYMTDDKPFLGDKNALARIRDPKATVASSAESEYYSMMTTGKPNGQAAPTDNEDGFLPLRFLAMLSMIGLVSVLILSLLPLLFKTVKAKNKPLTVLGLMCFFGFLGLGFMAFEMVMLQRAFLFVGDPGYATAVVLTTFLFFSGLGSLATGRIDPIRFKKAAGGAGAALFVLLAAYAYLLNVVFVDQLGLPQAVRILIFIGMLATPCFLSGMLFPIGMRAIGLIADDLIPWVWSVNSLAVVTGSALGALGSFFFGFRAVLGAGAFCYLAAGMLFILLRIPFVDTPRA